jgi:DNA primase
MLDQSTIDKITDAAQIQDVVGDYVTLRKRGVNLLGLCPFHNEKTPSFTVSPAKGIFKCFGCGKGGNSVHFIMEHEQISYYEALKYLARKYHIEFQERELSAEEMAIRNDRNIKRNSDRHFTGLQVHRDHGQHFQIDKHQQQICQRYFLQTDHRNDFGAYRKHTGNRDDHQTNILRPFQ